MKKLLTAGLVTLGMAATATANTTTVQLLSGDTATRLAATAVSVCNKQGYSVAAAVVDRFGNLLALSRHEMAGPHTVSSASQKAFTSASMGRDTGSLAQAVVDMPTLAGLADMDERIILLNGGLPISIEGTRVAGIGVGGAPGGHLDAACAEEAIKQHIK